MTDNPDQLIYSSQQSSFHNFFIKDSVSIHILNIEEYLTTILPMWNILYLSTVRIRLASSQVSSVSGSFSPNCFRARTSSCCVFTEIRLSSWLWTHKPLTGQWPWSFRTRGGCSRPRVVFIGAGPARSTKMSKRVFHLVFPLTSADFFLIFIKGTICLQDGRTSCSWHGASHTYASSLTTNSKSLKNKH